jgi:acyl-CoA oxidase
VSGEGSNPVMYLQTARFLLRQMSHFKKGNAKPSNKLEVAEWSTEMLLDTKSIVNIWQHVVDFFVLQTSMSVERKDVSNNQVPLNRCAELFSISLLVKDFAAAVEKLPANPMKTSLTKLVQLFGLYWLQQHSGAVVESEAMKPNQLVLLRELVLDLCAQIRPEAVALVDAFGISDFILNSTLGVYDGDVYNKTLEHVTKLYPRTDLPPKYWEREIKPLTNPQHHK